MDDGGSKENEVTLAANNICKIIELMDIIHQLTSLNEEKVNKMMYKYQKASEHLKTCANDAGNNDIDTLIDTIENMELKMTMMMVSLQKSTEQVKSSSGEIIKNLKNIVDDFRKEL